MSIMHLLLQKYIDNCDSMPIPVFLTTKLWVANCTAILVINCQISILVVSLDPMLGNSTLIPNYLVA